MRTIGHLWRVCWSTACGWGLFWIVFVERLWAQAPSPVPAPVGPSPIRPLWTEAAITLVMLGVALYVVCRNSNRN